METLFKADANASSCLPAITCYAYSSSGKTDEKIIIIKCWVFWQPTKPNSVKSAKCNMLGKTDWFWPEEIEGGTLK